MNADELKEMFDPYVEAHDMTFEQVATHVHEMRASEPDNINMTDAEIATVLQS